MKMRQKVPLTTMTGTNLPTELEQGMRFHTHPGIEQVECKQARTSEDQGFGPVIRRETLSWSPFTLLGFAGGMEFAGLYF